MHDVACDHQFEVRGPEDGAIVSVAVGDRHGIQVMVVKAECRVWVLGMGVIGVIEGLNEREVRFLDLVAWKPFLPQLPPDGGLLFHVFQDRCRGDGDSGRECGEDAGVAEEVVAVAVSDVDVFQGLAGYGFGDPGCDVARLILCN